jgi:hypothetical protein
MCVSRADTTCFPVHSCLGLYMVGGGVIISSIAVTISVPERGEEDGEEERARIRIRRGGEIGVKVYGEVDMER